MRKWLVPLVCLIILSMSVTALGCWPTRPEEDDNSLDPCSVETPVDPEDQDSSDINDNNDEDTETASTDLNTSVIVVPETAAGNISFAVIRQGDLWLGSPNGQMWRQTNTGNVSEVIWAPDGHGLAYIQSISWDTKHLYYQVPGSSPLLVDENVILNRSWWRPMGLLWSPDSAGLAYGTADGDQLRITQVPSLAQASYLMSKPIQQGPYWLAEDVLVYGTGRGDLPSVLLLDSSGQLIAELLETISPYPVPGGSLVITGTYDPDGMDSFYSSGMALVGLDGVILNDVYDQPIWHCMLAVSPEVAQHPLDPRYVAISTGESLFLQQYAGVVTKLNPTRKELMTQDVFLTFSEFLYPLWFSWAPDGSKLAALRFSFTREGDFGQQEGHWDLLLIDKQATQDLLLEGLYLVSGDKEPLLFQGIFPLNWSPCGNYVYYLGERDDGGLDLWRVDIRNKATEIVLENSGLPIFRPAQ